MQRRNTISDLDVYKFSKDDVKIQRLPPQLPAPAVTPRRDVTQIFSNPKQKVFPKIIVVTECI